MWNLTSGLDGRVVIVTGAAGGIGQACLKAFAASGSKVIACDRDHRVMDLLAQEFPDTERFRGLVADLSRQQEVECLVSDALHFSGKIDVLVNAAAVHLRLPLEEVDDDAWQQYLDANIKSQFYVCREVMRPMIAAQWGRIINFSSLAAYTGGFQPQSSVAYAATKGAALTMTRSLSRILAPHNILVNAIAPGGVRTAMARSLSESALTTYAENVPLGRLAEPEEIAGAALFLASDHASYITGAVLDINGGNYNH